MALGSFSRFNMFGLFQEADECHGEDFSSPCEVFSSKVRLFQQVMGILSSRNIRKFASKYSVKFEQNKLGSDVILFYFIRGVI